MAGRTFGQAETPAWFTCMGWKPQQKSSEASSVADNVSENKPLNFPTVGCGWCIQGTGRKDAEAARYVTFTGSEEEKPNIGRTAQQNKSRQNADTEVRKPVPSFSFCTACYSCRTADNSDAETFSRCTTKSWQYIFQ